MTYMTWIPRLRKGRVDAWAELEDCSMENTSTNHGCRIESDAMRLVVKMM